MNRLFAFILFLVFSIGISAQNHQTKQDVISSAGTRFQSNSMLIDWTLGEFAITTLQGNSSVISQGFHQPQFIITSVKEFIKNIGEIKVYPNPTQDLIQMNMTFDETQSIQVRLTDLNGKVLWYDEFNGQQVLESTSLRSFSNGTYFLTFKLKDTNSEQVFKIQKTN